MHRRLATLSLLLVVLSLPSFASRFVRINPQGRQARAQKLKSPFTGKVQGLGLTSKTPQARMMAPARPHTNLPANQISFISATQIPAGGAFPTPLMGDFNGDGKMDVASFVATSPVSSTYAISVLLSNGDGTFAQQPLIALDPSINGFIVGDVNGDGKADLVLVNFSASNPGPSPTFIPYLSNGDGTFSAGTSYSVPAATDLAGIFLIDVNGDGKLDFVAVDQVPFPTSSPTQNVWTLLGDGQGGFQSATSTALPIPAGFNGLNADYNLIMDNFDGNYPAELVGADTSTGQLTVYLASGTGVYANPVSLSTPDSHYDGCFTTSGDLNGDHKSEIVSTNCNDDTLTIYVNNGSGGFSSGTYYDAGASLYPPNTNPADNLANLYPVAVAIADVNGDGMNDLVSTDLFGGVTVLLGLGNGAVVPPTVGYATGQGIYSGTFAQQAMVADFNGDGRADILVSDNNFSLVYLEGKGDGTFRAARNYFSGDVHPGSLYGEGLLSGDFNGDGIPDFVVTNYDSSGANGITVFLSNPDGSMQPGVNYGTGGGYSYGAVADFNGDGILDIAVTDSNNGVVTIFTGNPSATNPKVGDGTFTQVSTNFPTDTVTTSQPAGIVAADFNGDGMIDLAFVNVTTSDVGVLINNSSNGKVGFAGVVNYSLIGTPALLSLAAGDVNGDKIPDLVIPATVSGTGVVMMLPGVGDGTFSVANGWQVPTVSSKPLWVAIGDLNGDGIADLAVSVDDSNNGNGIDIILGTGAGAFGTPALLPSTLQPATSGTGSGPGTLLISDVNGDGLPDVVFTNQLFGTIGILYGTGGGNFSGPVEFPGSMLNNGLVLADVNGDGATDVITAGYFSGVTVLLNAVSAATSPVASSTTLVSSLNPATPGQSVTLTATVKASTGTNTAVPSGTVSFADGTKNLGSATLSINGVAALSTTSLAVGTHNIVASYSGDSTYAASTSQAVSEIVNPAPVPDYTLSANPQGASMTAGGSASITITLTPSNGYNGTVSFNCGTLPKGMSCSFNPASLTPTGNQAVTSTLTITTTGATAILMAPRLLNRNRAESALLASISGMGLVGLVSLGGTKRNRSRVGIVLGVVVLVMIMGLVGCGGSSNSSGNNGGGNSNGTPAGNYTVQITASGTAGTNGGNTAGHALNISVTVQ